jgi:hypothetical protein
MGCAIKPTFTSPYALTRFDSNIDGRSADPITTQFWTHGSGESGRFTPRVVSFRAVTRVGASPSRRRVPRDGTRQISEMPAMKCLLCAKLDYHFTPCAVCLSCGLPIGLDSCLFLMPKEENFLSDGSKLV